MPKRRFSPPVPGRYDRRFSSTPDQRSEGQRDRDRILYTAAFRRLAGVTQVAAAGERHNFHTRLTHSLKVAQVARRIAEYQISERSPTPRSLISELGDIDPDVVEAAALAHDLGHPPFGHIAEVELQKELDELGLPEAFEGNPQSFRIVTVLELRQERVPGLNLTRATLNAILKYPWFWQGDHPQKGRKWGAYRTEGDDFVWARAMCPPGDETQSLEAAIMDWADDISYSVHDLEDFYRVGLIPLDRLASDEREQQRFIDRSNERRKNDGLKRIPRIRMERAITFVREEISFRFKGLLEPYSGGATQRAQLRAFTSSLIANFATNGLRFKRPNNSKQEKYEILEPAKSDVSTLKELTWVYVIGNPSLATQQAGQRRIIKDLLKELYAAARYGASRNLRIFPPAVRERILKTDAVWPADAKEHAVLRVVTDMIASLTEDQAIHLHDRLTGYTPSSVADIASW